MISKNRGKIQKAAAHPKRPGQQCQAEPGTWAPVIDRNRCEGKQDCAEVCPHDVFTIERMSDEDYDALAWMGKIKATFHGRMTAYTPNADQCRACGLCVVACPENAIRLAPA